jgi:chemotaxis protein methyltransferase CheR
MSNSITESEFKLIRDYVEENCGIALGDEKAYLIETRLTKLMVENGCEDFGQFYQLIKKTGGAALRDKIVDAMTTNETLWFRDGHPYTILKEKILPDLLKQVQQGKKKPIRIWSAASSTGQEPYSIAITIKEFCKTQATLSAEDFEIVATDISPSALFLAHAARYDQIAVSRGLDEGIRDKYFRKNGRVWVLDDSIKKMVTFKKFNLQEAPLSLGSFDVVFLRYVAIYFSNELKMKIFENLARALAQNKGYFIIGAIESLRGLTDSFEMFSHAGGSYYKRTS